MAGSRGEWAEVRPLAGCCWRRLGQGAGEVEYEPEAAQTAQAAEGPEELEEENRSEAPKFSAGTSEEAHSENRGRLGSGWMVLPLSHSPHHGGWRLIPEFIQSLLLMVSMGQVGPLGTSAEQMKASHKECRGHCCTP